jgi:catalase
VKVKSDGYLFEELEGRLREGEVRFRLVVQVAEEGDVVDDATIRWPEERQIVELGTLTAEKYVEEDESLQEQQRLIFDPIPRVKGIEASDDPILEMRAALYLISGRIRRQADGVVG